MTSQFIDAWWFEPAYGRLQFDDGRKPIKGRTHKVKCDPVLCESGLHASVRLIDALQYATSDVVWRVQLGGTIVHGNDKCAATERKYIHRIDIEAELFQFSRWSALQVIHLWDAPAVVREFLETGNDALRAAARDAARAAPWDSARASARDAARDAARAAARDAASAAAWDSARAAARAAAWDSARAAAWNAARAAARDAQNIELERLVISRMSNEPLSPPIL
mgnify:FL=1